MPTPPRPDTQIFDSSEAEAAIVELAWPEDSARTLIGLEVEAFAVMESDGGPIGRLPLRGASSVSALVDSTVTDNGPTRRSGEGLAFSSTDGGRITFEPGGQIEHSTAPHRRTDTLMSEIDGIWDLLHTRFREEQVALVSIGVDPWHATHQVPQQQLAGRYKAMDRYFARRWPTGATMMRNTCSIQVNLEAGTGSVRAERWTAANLLSPLLTAMFACSPGDSGAKSTRAQVWQRIDPSRTGLPSWASATDANPVEDVVRRSLDAYVMFVNREGKTIPVTSGLTLADWVANGGASFGRPTVGDLQVHMSTLFTEVRPRFGVLELRGIDAFPRRWWVVPGVMGAALLYDDEARGAVIEMLARFGSDLHSTWLRAAALGLSDPELRGAAEKLGHIALEAADRCVEVDPQGLARTRDFLERFTMRGLSPADEFSLLRSDPRSALAWATASAGEPVR